MERHVFLVSKNKVYFIQEQWTQPPPFTRLAPQRDRETILYLLSSFQINFQRLEKPNEIDIPPFEVAGSYLPS